MSNKPSPFMSIWLGLPLLWMLIAGKAYGNGVVFNFSDFGNSFIRVLISCMGSIVVVDSCAVTALMVWGRKLVTAMLIRMPRLIYPILRRKVFM